MLLNSEVNFAKTKYLQLAYKKTNAQPVKMVCFLTPIEEIELARPGTTTATTVNMTPKHQSTNHI